MQEIKEESQKLYSDTKSIRNKVICVLIGSIVLTTFLITFSPNNNKILLGDIFAPLAAAIAVAFSGLIIYRQKTDGLIGKAYSSLAIGLVLFLIAEIIWSYYEIGLQIQNPFPSIADALWLIGYAPLSYFVFKMYRFFGVSHSRSHQIVISVASALFLLFLINDIYQKANLTSQTGILSFLISISYPILDILLLVPAALIILNPVKGELTSIPWIFLAVLIMNVGDTTFAYSSNIVFLQNLSWIWNLFFITSYFVTSAGLFWHNRFFIHSSKEIKRSKT
jgi:hypothetical protein